MISRPAVITEVSFQFAWIKAAKFCLRGNGVHNLMVGIQNVNEFDYDIHKKICGFTKRIGILTPKQVAYTIFPEGLYRKQKTSTDLFTAYCRPNGFYHRVRSLSPGGWGTYFYRMICYEGGARTENQLENVIRAINSRDNTHKAAYTILIQHPGSETTRPRGGPCLNYIAVQLEQGIQRELGLLCVYRNHDFLERAYGNYWGLCNLLKFISQETDSRPGPLTCISSHAYVSGQRNELKKFLEAWD